MGSHNLTLPVLFPQGTAGWPPGDTPLINSAEMQPEIHLTDFSKYATPEIDPDRPHFGQGYPQLRLKLASYPREICLVRGFRANAQAMRNSAIREKLST